MAKRQSELARYRDALEYIAHPVRALQREADAKGCRINGLAAVLLSEDASHLRSVASDALKLKRRKESR